jgi:hypothetical protein
MACAAEFPQLIRDAYSLAQHPELGIYRVLVCKNGWWQTVVVDDYLPTLNGRPCFARNRREPNELWVSLLEKAYAKVHGSYAAIKSGDAPHAVADLLGSPYRTFKQLPFFSDKDELFQYLLISDEADDIMTLTAPSKKSIIESGSDVGKMEKHYADHGLSIDHAYSLLRVRQPRKDLRLCMIRNPWGNEKEWNGAWSDDSSLWTPELQKEVGFYKGEDGVFWMCWEDVIKFFDGGSVSHVLREWPQLRVTGNFVNGPPDLVVHLYVSAPAKCHFGVHQRDCRGLPSGDKDSTYIPALITVLKQEDSKKFVIAAESNNGSYGTYRDSFCEATLMPQPLPYIILAQTSRDVSKSFTISIILSDVAAFEKICFFTSEGDIANRRRYLPPTKFQVSDYSRKASAFYQIRVANPNSDGMLLESATAHEVRKTTIDTVKTKKLVERQYLIASISNPQAARPDEPKHRDPVAAPKAVPCETTLRKRRFQVLVLSARNLVPPNKERSNPYVHVKVTNAKGDDIASLDGRESTRVLPDTMQPVWCDSFVFECSDGDSLHLAIMDDSSLDECAMGSLELRVETLIEKWKLTAGGPAVITWMHLGPPPRNAAGEIQLGFSLML